MLDKPSSSVSAMWPNGLVRNVALLSPYNIVFLITVLSFTHLATPKLHLLNLTANSINFDEFSKDFKHNLRSEMLRKPVLYTNQYAVRLSPGTDPKIIADKYGIKHLTQIGSLEGYHLYENPKIRKRSVTPGHEHVQKLSLEPQILWFNQQVEKKRVKRSLPEFQDPLYPLQWYLTGSGSSGDLGVLGAWAKGYTGKGIVVSILDDGLQTNHPDLQLNYDRLASYDINEEDPDPTPRDSGDNKHGTRCAGEVAATAGNRFCGVGIAYNASVGGVRMLDGVVNDAVEARALSLNPQHIDIYSASWGPEDDGRTLDGPGPLASRAFINGITKGRGGKGSIFVWASGNGGRQSDWCSCDGYTNSIYTLSISSATHHGVKPWYLEECASTLATTYSSGTPGSDPSIATTDMDLGLNQENLCTTQHTGTSAGAPLAAGLCALALEANPDLTWRDMQHIVVNSAKHQPLSGERGWSTNGANRKVSHKFGFGLMNGEAIVELAESWTTVPLQHICKTLVLLEERTVETRIAKWYVNVSSCWKVRYLEGVELLIWADWFPRGALELILTSPSGSSSILLGKRSADTLATELDGWPFLSVHYWGEDPHGTWTLTVHNTGYPRTRGILKKWQLAFYGTETNPVILQPNIKSLKPVINDLFESEEMSEEEEDSNFIDTESLITNCHSECDLRGCYGESASSCLSCRNYKFHKECVPECPEGYFAGRRGVCKQCHGNCFRCNGPEPTDCLSCSNQLYLLTDLGLCLPSCPIPYYQDDENKRCLSCKSGCASCRTNPNECTSCNPHLILHESSCLYDCPSHTYRSHDNRCKPCWNSCNKCIGPTKNDCRDVLRTSDCKSSICQKCSQGYFLSNFTCVITCPVGYFGKVGICMQCWEGCTRCFGSRRDECLDCRSGMTLGRGQCRPHCPRNAYSSSTGCTRCHHFCSTCNGGGAYGCTSCTFGRYMDEKSALCSPCLRQCATCSEPTSCTACPRHTTLRNGTCIDTHSLINEHQPMTANMSKDEGWRWNGRRRSYDEKTGMISDGFSPLVILTAITCIAIIILFALIILTLQPYRLDNRRKVPIPRKKMKHSSREITLNTVKNKDATFL